jgi:hypothetical protein
MAGADTRELVKELPKAAKEGLHRCCACFETRRFGAPQHEAYQWMAVRNVLILRKPQSGCLEGRTALVQPIVNSFTASRRETG